MDKHNCRDLYEKVVMALDGALNHDEEKLLLAEVERCSCCLDQLNIQKAFKEFLRRKIERKCVSNDLMAQIRENIKQSS